MTTDQRIDWKAEAREGAHQLNNVLCLFDLYPRDAEYHTVREALEHIARIADVAPIALTKRLGHYLYEQGYRQDDEPAPPPPPPYTKDGRPWPYCIPPAPPAPPPTAASLRARERVLPLPCTPRPATWVPAPLADVPGTSFMLTNDGTVAQYRALVWPHITAGWWPHTAAGWWAATRNDDWTVLCVGRKKAMRAAERRVAELEAAGHQWE
jgi:hypothetical protein